MRKLRPKVICWRSHRDSLGKEWGLEFEFPVSSPCVLFHTTWLPFWYFDRSIISFLWIVFPANSTYYSPSMSFHLVGVMSLSSHKSSTGGPLSMHCDILERWAFFIHFVFLFWSFKQNLWLGISFRTYSVVTCHLLYWLTEKSFELFYYYVKYKFSSVFSYPFSSYP